MACGTPVVATAVGALPELVRTGGGGVLVPPDDPEAMAKAIATLAEQPDARRELGARAPARIEAAYAWPRVAAHTAEVYREVLAERRAARGRPASTTTSA
jgi:glycosyltransferase involved in cell wall biosynthesis